MNQDNQKARHKAICDTIDLMLLRADFEIVAPEKFTPNANFVLQNKNQQLSAIQNMQTVAKFGQKYTPKLTLRNHFIGTCFQTVLYIELSLPKLLYGNNLKEVTDDDFPLIISKLLEVLEIMGVETTPRALVYAHVCRIHYGKNIILKGGINPGFILTFIKQANISRIFDSNQTDYRNDGHCVKVQSKYHGFAIYDKILDIKQQYKCSARCLDAEAHRNYQHVDIKALGNKQVLRIETRLNDVKAVRRMIESSGLEAPECLFKNLFSSKIAKAVNCYHWQKICAAVRPLMFMQDDLMAIWFYYLTQVKELKGLQMLGLTVAIRETSINFVKSQLKACPTGLNLIRELKKYEPSSHWMENLFQMVTKELEENNVVNSDLNNVSLDD